MLDCQRTTGTVEQVERETDDIFRRLTADLEAEFSAIERNAQRSPLRGRRTSRRRSSVAAGVAGTLGTAATMAIGLINPFLGAACMLATVLGVARLLR